MSKYLKITLVFLLFLSCCGCSSKKSEQAIQTITVTSQPTENTLYFSGTLTPIQFYNINTPAAGVVIKKSFDYGQDVEKGEAILVLQSSQFAEDYRAALEGYLKAKKDYLNNLTQMQGIEYLKKAGILSENEYVTNKSSNFDLLISYHQAARKLESFLTKMNIPSVNILQLRLEDVASVNKALAQPADILTIRSPTAGIALLPSKGSGDSGGDSSEGSPLVNGSEVKADQTLLTIGERTGVAVLIKVSEVHINDIHIGQKATITGDGFPGITLDGKVTYINQQATAADSSSAPTFAVKVTVAKLTPEQHKVIHVGMSAKIAIIIQGEAHISIPIQAVVTQNGASVVKIIDPKTQKIISVPVVTGATTLDSVNIEQGLKPGDKVVINAPSN